MVATNTMAKASAANLECRKRMAASSRKVGEGVREFRISPASDMAGVAGDHLSIVGKLWFEKAIETKLLSFLSRIAMG